MIGKLRERFEIRRKFFDPPGSFKGEWGVDQWYQASYGAKAGNMLERIKPFTIHPSNINIIFLSKFLLFSFISQKNFRSPKRLAGVRGMRIFDIKKCIKKTDRGIDVCFSFVVHQQCSFDVIQLLK